MRSTWVKLHSLITGVIAASAIILMAPGCSWALVASSMVPASGPVTGGNMVTIRGSGFMRRESEKFADIAAGVDHAVMLSTNGHVWTVGANEYGQLGDNRLATNSVVTPVDITDRFNLDSDDRIVAIASGDYHSFAVSDNRRIFAWGKNTYGQLGDKTQIDRNVPVDITDNFQLDTGDYVVAISAGVDTSFALTNNGETLLWGDSTDYQDGQTNERFAPRTTPQVATSWMTEHLRQIAIGNKSGISLNTNGRIMTWGSNRYGELGRTHGEMVNRFGSYESMYPITDNFDLVEGDVIIQVEAGDGVMAALTKYHRVYIWGNNQTGMLGLGDDAPNPYDPVAGNDLSSTPLDITDLFNLPDEDCISQISIGNSHVLALSQYGQVFAWGEGDYGQLGNGQMANQPAVVNITDQFKLADGVTVQKVLASGAGDALLASYSYALTSDGSVYAWGGSSKGLPGINAITNTATPAMISGRLSVDVPNVASINFAGQPATDYDVLGDETIQVLAPAGLGPGPVKVEVVDNDGNSLELTQEYNYTESTGSLTPDDQLGDDDSDLDNQGSQDSDQSSDGDSSNSSTSGQNKADDTNATNADGGADKDAEKTTSGNSIAAPNTGVMMLAGN